MAEGLTPAQTRRAARLYSLAVVAMQDMHDVDDDEEQQVVSEAIRRARAELARAAPGISPFIFTSLSVVIAYVKEPGTR
jgi:hypothetical protein